MFSFLFLNWTPQGGLDYVHPMHLATKDYSVYLPKKPVNSFWGCVATGVGFGNILANTTYPSRQHPVDRLFNWKEGRVLNCYQIVLISAGQGVFESEGLSEAQSVEPGTVMVLFPGVWHRYRPLAETGWVENWIECQGSVFDEAVRTGLIKPEHGLQKGGVVRDVSDCFARCHSLARIDALANQDLLSTLGCHLLALVGHMRRKERGFTKAIDEVVQRAHTLIALRCHEPLDLEGLAGELGVGYSNLRHSFLARVGVSPREHYLISRIEKSQELLVNTSKSVKEIAEILGFESASHFSKQFKGRIGVSPADWRGKGSGR